MVPKHSAHFQHITQHNDLIRDTQHNIIQNNDTLHSEIIRDNQHNIIQHNDLIRDIQHNELI